MNGCNIHVTAVVICLWVFKLRKIDGFNCSTGDPPLWESPTKRCTLYVNWNCTLNKGDSVMLKTWIKDDNVTVASWDLKSNFTIKSNIFIGRFERYKENGFILNGLTITDVGHYKLVVMLNRTGDYFEERTKQIYVPSIPSCEKEIHAGNNSSLNGGDDTTQLSPCVGGQMPLYAIGILTAFVILILVLSLTVICLCRKQRLLHNNLGERHSGEGEEHPLSVGPGSQV